MAIDLVLNRHKKIQNMSIDEMAKYFGVTLNLCVKPGTQPCYCFECHSCTQCWKEFLQGSGN